MLLEAILSLHLAQRPMLPPVMAASFSSSSSSSVVAKSYGGSSFRSSSFSSPSRSFSSGSSSFSRPSGFNSPSKSFSSPKTAPAPKISAPPKAPTIQRIDKQVTPKVSPIPSSRPSAPATPARPAPTPVVTRETYVERYHDSGPFSSPWFWIWAMDRDRPAQQQPAQVIVRNADGEFTKVAPEQLVVRRTYSWSPVREFFVFALGGGIGVLVGRKVSL